MRWPSYQKPGNPQNRYRRSVTVVSGTVVPAGIGKSPLWSRNVLAALRRACLIQTAVRDDDRAPPFLTAGHLSPVYQKSSAVDEDALALGHLLESLIPRPAHPTLIQQEIPDRVSAHPVSQARG